MYCVNCGKELHDEAVICPACGRATGRYVQPAQKIGNPLAIVGFVCAIVSWLFFMIGVSTDEEIFVVFLLMHIVLGFVFSLIGWVKSVRRKTGKGLAIAGFVVSGVWVALLQIGMFIAIFF